MSKDVFLNERIKQEQARDAARQAGDVRTACRMSAELLGIKPTYLLQPGVYLDGRVRVFDVLDSPHSDFQAYYNPLAATFYSGRTDQQRANHASSLVDQAVILVSPTIGTFYSAITPDAHCILGAASPGIDFIVPSLRDAGYKITDDESPKYADALRPWEWLFNHVQTDGILPPVNTDHSPGAAYRNVQIDGSHPTREIATESPRENDE